MQLSWIKLKNEKQKNFCSKLIYWVMWNTTLSIFPQSDKDFNIKRRTSFPIMRNCQQTLTMPCAQTFWRRSSLATPMSSWGIGVRWRKTTLRVQVISSIQQNINKYNQQCEPRSAKVRVSPITPLSSIWRTGDIPTICNVTKDCEHPKKGHALRCYKVPKTIQYRMQHP